MSNKKSFNGHSVVIQLLRNEMLEFWRGRSCHAIVVWVWEI
jgi:hypothetical protein